MAITGKAQKQGRVEADPVRKEEPYSSLPQPKYITINEYKSKYIYPASVKSGILRERRSCVCQWEGRNMSKARQAIPTVTFVDEYCQRYQDLFPDVRIGNTSSFCMWAYSQRSNARRCPPSRRQLAIVIHRRSTTRVAEAPWSVEELRTRRLTLLGQALAGRSFVLCMDETGDRKKSNTTDYVAHQS